MISEITLKLPRLHAGQQQLVRESRRFNVTCNGRRWGKSVFGVDRLVRPAIAGKLVAYFCPTHKMLAEIWRETRRVLAPVIDTANETSHRITLHTGGIIDMWSLENYDSIRGRKYHRAVIDEAAMCAHLEDAWASVIRPTLTDYVGDAFFMSTPKGINFFKTLFDRGQDPERLNWKSWQMPTSSNPYIKPSEIEDARLELPENVFRQEYLAEFLQNAGSVFRRIAENLTAPMDATPGEHRGHRIVVGVDWGQKHDYTVLSAFCVTCMCEVELDRFNKISWSFQRERLHTIYSKWQIAVAMIEENSIGSPNIEVLRDEGLIVQAFQMTPQSKSPLIQSLALSFERLEARWLPVPVASAELVAYESSINPVTARVSYSAPSGSHDDTVIARALARRAADQGGGEVEHGESLW
ncbi:MAG: terminase family protein [Acidobacteriota bacterium]|nr:terminase family protein [Acidobacteriota bacterium]